MQTTLGVVRNRMTLCSVLMITVAVLIVIVGLVAMHAIGVPVGTGTGHQSAMSTAAGHSGALGTFEDEPTAVQCDDDCAPGTRHDHDETLMLCALVLFAGLLMLYRPTFIASLGPPPRRLVLLARLRAVTAVARPPSLTFLSISRT